MAVSAEKRHSRRWRDWVDLLQLTRMHRPVGIWLLLWPTLWAVWIASRGSPEPVVVWIYSLEIGRAHV